VRNNKVALSEVVRRQGGAGPHTRRPRLPGETRFNSNESMFDSVDSLVRVHKKGLDHTTASSQKLQQIKF
jgi:hypothetical protein